MTLRLVDTIVSGTTTVRDEIIVLIDKLVTTSDLVTVDGFKTFLVVLVEMDTRVTVRCLILVVPD